MSKQPRFSRKYLNMLIIVTTIMIVLFSIVGHKQEVKMPLSVDDKTQSLKVK